MHGAVLLPASLVYGGIGPLVVELARPQDDPSLTPLHFASAIFATSALGFLGAYAISYGLIQLSLGRAVSPGEVLASPWREARWAVPLALLLAAITVIGILLGILPKILADILLLLIAPVAAAERLGVWQALVRAWQLPDGERMRAAGLYAVVAMAMVAAGSPAELLGGPDAVPALAVTACLGAFVANFGDVAVFLLYADLRVRRERFHLELLDRPVEEPLE